MWQWFSSDQTIRNIHHWFRMGGTSWQSAKCGRHLTPGVVNLRSEVLSSVLALELFERDNLKK